MKANPSKHNMSGWQLRGTFPRPHPPLPTHSQPPLLPFSRVSLSCLSSPNNLALLLLLSLHRISFLFITIMFLIIWRYVQELGDVCELRRGKKRWFGAFIFIKSEYLGEFGPPLVISDIFSGHIRLRQNVEKSGIKAAYISYSVEF